MTCPNEGRNCIHCTNMTRRAIGLEPLRESKEAPVKAVPNGWRLYAAGIVLALIAVVLIVRME